MKTAMMIKIMIKMMMMILMRHFRLMPDLPITCLKPLSHSSSFSRVHSGLNTYYDHHDDQDDDDDDDGDDDDSNTQELKPGHKCGTL